MTNSIYNFQEEEGKTVKNAKHTKITTNIKSCKDVSRTAHNSKLIYSEINVQTTIKRRKTVKPHREDLLSGEHFYVFMWIGLQENKKKKKKKNCGMLCMLREMGKNFPNIYPTTIIEIEEGLAPLQNQ